MIIKCGNGYFFPSYILIIIFLISTSNAFISYYNDSMPFVFYLFAVTFFIFWFNFTVGYSISVCKTLTFNREGIEVSIWFYKKFYKWDELKFKKLESYRNYLITKSETHQPPYVRCVKFYKKNIKKSKFRNPFLFFCMSHPISFNYVNFLDESITEKDLKKFISTRFTYNEKEFMDNMKKWGVKIEEDL